MRRHVSRTTDSPTTSHFWPIADKFLHFACRVTHDAAIIDPAWEGKALADHVTDLGFTVTAILLTHSHWDHVGGLVELKSNRRTGLCPCRCRSYVAGSFRHRPKIWSDIVTT